MNLKEDLKDQRLFRQQCFVNGIWIGPGDESVLDVFNPSNDSKLGSVPKIGAAETRHAIEAANNAWPKWRALTAKERGQRLKEMFRLIIANQDDLARIMTAEQGKPLAEAAGEVAYGASFFEWFAEEAKRAYGDVIPEHQAGKRIIAVKEPIGVAAAITPWNFPNAMIARKCAPALAAGCPVVIKPASATPFSALALAELASRAGFPPGVFNVITGPAPEIGAELTSNPLVRKVSFTGSTETGKLLLSQCASTVKKVSLELGGNAPFIVFNDADLKAAVDGAIACKFRNSGQTCVCANRLLVQDEIHDQFAAMLAGKAALLKVADGFEPGAEQGPLISMAAVKKVEQHINDALALGAKILTGGKRHRLGGAFFEPTVLVNATPDMAVTREETFGPLAPLFRFKTEEQAISMANDTGFGLAAYFYSRDVGRVFRVARALEYGIVGVNTGIISTEVAPFGGIKESGIGREGSRHGMDEYLEIKYLCLGGIDQ